MSSSCEVLLATMYFIPMRKIQVHLKDHSYDILVASGLSRKLPELIRPFRRQGKTLVLSDTTVHRLHAPVFAKLKNADTHFFFIKPGETSKTLKTIEQSLSFYAGHSLYTGTHKFVVTGRFKRWRKNRCKPCTGKKPDRFVLPAQGRVY